MGTGLSPAGGKAPRSPAASVVCNPSPASAGIHRGFEKGRRSTRTFSPACGDYTTVRALEATLVFPSPPLAGILRPSVRTVDARRTRTQDGRRLAARGPRRMERMAHVPRGILMQRMQTIELQVQDDRNCVGRGDGAAAPTHGGMVAPDPENTDDRDLRHRSRSAQHPTRRALRGLARADVAHADCRRRGRDREGEPRPHGPGRQVALLGRDEPARHPEGTRGIGHPAARRTEPIWAATFARVAAEWTVEMAIARGEAWAYPEPREIWLGWRRTSRRTNSESCSEKP